MIYDAVLQAQAAGWCVQDMNAARGLYGRTSPGDAQIARAQASLDHARDALRDALRNEDAQESARGYAHAAQVLRNVDQRLRTSRCREYVLEDFCDTMDYLSVCTALDEIPGIVALDQAVHHGLVLSRRRHISIWPVPLLSIARDPHKIIAGRLEHAAELVRNAQTLL